MKQYNKSISGKIFNYFRQRLNIKQSTKGWWRCNCVYCGGKYTMGINMDYSKVHCFKCDEENTPIKTIMYIEKFETIHQFFAFINIQQEYEGYDNFTRQKKIDQKAISLPQGFHLLGQGKDAMARAARHYMSKRGFNIERLSMKGIGYCTEGEYEGYIIFPFYRKGELIYYQGRLYMGIGPKMRNPPEEEYGIGKSRLVYNLDAFYIYNRAFLVESITNAETIGDSAAALLGKKISDYQFSQILMSPCERVIIILDDDALKEAVNLAMSMVHYKKTKLIHMPTGIDVNDYGKGQTLSLVKATKYHTYNELYRMRTI